MKKIGMVLTMLSVGVAAFGVESLDLLKTIDAPAEEFVRMPAKYILQKLGQRANESGEISLAGFTVVDELPGIGDKRVTLNLEGMNLHQALEAVATAVGAGVEYSQGRAVLKDPSDIVVQVADIPEPLAEDEKEKANEPITFTDINSALVFVENGDGRGSAFIARMNGKIYIFSNQHNFLGATQIRLRAMDGRYLKPTSFEYCRARDLIRMEISEKEIETLSALDLSDETPDIGMEVAVYGNSAGGGVVTELLGEVLGVGPDDIEIDAEIVSGNSGSPILDTSGNVLGVATYISLERKFAKNDPRSEIFKGTRFKNSRRFGVRIPDNGWVQASLKEYLQQTYLIVDMESYLDALYILVQYWIENDDFAVPASRLISAYSKIGLVKDTPYDFRDSQTEELLRMTVRAFHMNYAEMGAEFAELSVNEKENLGGRISHLLLKSTKEAQETLQDTPWMSNYLKESSDPLKRLAKELIHVLESRENPYIKFQRKKSKVL